MTDVKETIKYNVYRGHLEPVGEVRKSEVHLYQNYMEIIASYDFTPYLDSEDVPYRKYACLIPKSQLAIELTEEWNDQDPDKVAYPVVKIIVEGVLADHIYVKTEKEAYDIYTRIKTWLIND